jgi:hypothetical protein
MRCLVNAIFVSNVSGDVFFGGDSPQLEFSFVSFQGNENFSDPSRKKCILLAYSLTKKISLTSEVI